MSGHDLAPAHGGPEDGGRERTFLLGNLEHVVVCGACADAVGLMERLDDPAGTLDQLGRCPLHRGPEQPTWPRYDYNRFVELCRCCGTVPLESGSRFSIWFCPECRTRVHELNRRLGRYAIPIGRHSVHAARLLMGSEASDPIAVQLFVDSMNAAFDAMHVLQDWAQAAIRRNLGVIGEKSGAVLPLEDYVRATGAHIDRLQRFREMCWFLDQRGREMVEMGER